MKEENPCSTVDKTLSTPYADLTSTSIQVRPES
ncbi:hypothetical protein NC652_031604 [Populus alba x Populus x berolinensis]|uniref:Uncharacterized protein n=1 Tax=Populus alba x Populus x berolinensis TaxID=444605 RepID=A0AAD6LYC1_9ROSI|nr:hypothetical protein NC651_030568 [Populus alba x Populus x berolinensis]KAJ6884652.1 hypothetical protein NC652_031604 [Populus alba x Populus x berolinensis]KAJ6975570.1 hypothetical protein NC653_031416 [Populus alba x Populus x berolinensis]